MNPFGGTPVGFGAPAPAAAPAPAFGAPAPAAGLAPVGVSVPLELRGGDGASVTVYLHFGPEHCAGLDGIGNLVSQLFAVNLPVKVWRPKREGNSFNGGGGRRW